MPDHHLPYDVARCMGAPADDPELIYRPDCDACLRRLAPPHPDPRRTQWVAPQPAPCPHRILPWQPCD